MSTEEIPQPSKATITMEQFFTRQRANEGIKLPLSLPDGTATEHHIHIRGIDSDIFKQAEQEGQRRVLELMTDLQDKAKAAQIMAEERLKVVAALVIGWSFSQSCTPENVLKLLKEAPQICEQVDRLASKRRLFFMAGSSSSTPSPAQSSS